MTTATPKAATPKATTPKAATPKKAAPAQKPKVAQAAAAPSQDTPDSTPPAPAALRLKELVERVVASTGGKKKGVKEIVEATLAELGLALGKGEMLNLPALGRLRVARTQGANEGSAMTLKLRPATAEGARKKPVKETLAEPAEHG